MKEPAVEDESAAGRACHLDLVRAVALVRTASELVTAGYSLRPAQIEDTLNFARQKRHA